MEDMEMKHNSAIKQLMREFNTQMALKEKELEASVKEAIGKGSIWNFFRIPNSQTFIYPA